MGQTSVTRLVANMAELESKHSSGTFVRTVREGDIVFIIQRCSNNKGRYVSIQEVHKGGRRVSIIIPEGKNGRGWRGFGFELRQAIGLDGGQRDSATIVKPRSNDHGVDISGGSATFAAVTAAKGRFGGRAIDGGDEKGKSSILGKASISVETSLQIPQRLTLNLETKDTKKLETQAPAKPLPIVTNGPRPVFKGDKANLPPANTKPKPTRFEWRPRVGQPNTVGLINPLTPSGPKLPHLIALEPKQIPAPPSHSVVVYEPPVSGDLIQRTWGSVSNWMLELRDGRRLSIPLSLIHTMPTPIGEVHRGTSESGPMDLEPLDLSSNGNSSRHCLWGF
ncbi:pentatricopeptide repeat-containing protein [Fagus crenata]